MKIINNMKQVWLTVRPGQRAWQGAAMGVIVGTLLWGIVACLDAFGPAGELNFVLGAVVVLGALALLSRVALLLLSIILRLGGVFPLAYRWAFLWLLLLFLGFWSLNTGPLVFLLGLVIISSLLGASLKTLVGGRWQTATRGQRIIVGGASSIGLLGLALGSWWLFTDGNPGTPPPNAALLSDAAIAPLTATDPSQPGSYTVRTLYYGSGQDRHRPEYGAAVDLPTSSVNGTALLEDWSLFHDNYWGFGPETLPRNARVWYPDGTGQFPLVLIVHGAHTMEEFSDPGYAYLGELLASRGFIFVAVDQNFLNSSASAGLGFFDLEEENDARGWLLLEHLQLWRNWNEMPGNPFYQKVDMDNIALLGHSRGGEAVVVAAAFNHLPYYPDNASLTFDFNFNIRSIVTLAPVDGQYSPAQRVTPLTNVNYLVLQGAHDMDVSWFLGERVYKRLQFTDDQFWVKSAVYIYGANHGQFNTVWGRKDLGEPYSRLYNLNQLMSGEDQRQATKVYVAAFLAATLQNEPGYLPLFRDARTAADWLPETIYLTQYEDANTHLVSTYEEDINLETTTLPGGTQSNKNLTTWREQVVPSKVGTTENSAVYLGWDTSAAATIPYYAIDLPPNDWDLTADSVLVFSLADAGAAAAADPQLIDLTVALTDSNGVTVRRPLSQYALLQPQIEGQIFKAAWMSDLPATEIIFQSFEFPLATFIIDNPTFDPTNIRTIRLEFDRTATGLIVLDDIGFRLGETAS